MWSIFYGVHKTYDWPYISENINYMQLATLAHSQQFSVLFLQTREFHVPDKVDRATSKDWPL
jgi:hypothetical protein